MGYCIFVVFCSLSYVVGLFRLFHIFNCIDIFLLIYFYLNHYEIHQGLKELYLSHAYGCYVWRVGRSRKMHIP